MQISFWLLHQSVPSSRHWPACHSPRHLGDSLLLWSALLKGPLLLLPGLHKSLFDLSPRNARFWLPPPVSISSHCSFVPSLRCRFLASALVTVYSNHRMFGIRLVSRIKRNSEIGHAAILGNSGVRISCVKANHAMAITHPTTPPYATWLHVWYSRYTRLYDTSRAPVTRHTDRMCLHNKSRQRALFVWCILKYRKRKA